MFDYFGACLVILIISWFTNKIFYVFWLLPFYLGYLLAKKIWGFIGKSYEEEETDQK
jgi:hypothetical protein